MSTAFRTLRNRDFRLFLGGQVVSLIGTWMQMVAESWLVYRLTGSAALLGVVGFANQMPACLLGPLGGVAADRYDRHRVILVTQTAAMALAFILAALTLTGVIRIWHVFVLATLLGVVNAFDIPARSSFLIDLAGRADLVNAIALNSSSFNAARMLGPAIAGATVATLGEGWCFFLNGVSFLAVIAGLLAMNVKRRDIRGRTGSAFSHMAEGFLYCWRNRLVRALLLLVAVTSLLAFPFATLLPLFADRILGRGAGAYGLLTAASGLGSLGGALTLATRSHVGGLRRWTFLFTAAGAVAIVCFGLSRLFWVSFGMVAVAGAALMIGIGSANSLIQDGVPDGLRGRVNAVYAMTFMGMAPVGSLLAGIAAEHIGAPLTVAAGGIGTAAAAALLGARFHHAESADPPRAWQFGR